MATIKDIAKLAGVSQGTVSNVLNNKGNVSSEKIISVQAVAKQLGYTVNERARMLRQGHANIIAVVLPNIVYKSYRDFYISFKNAGEFLGYGVMLYLTNGDFETEKKIIETMRSNMVSGVAVFTSISGEVNQYKKQGFSDDQVIFVENKPDFKCNYFGFNYYQAGFTLGKSVEKNNYRNILVLSESRQKTGNEFKLGIKKSINLSKVNAFENLSIYETNIKRAMLKFFRKNPFPDVVFSSKYEFAKGLQEIKELTFNTDKIDIFTLSPFFTLPKENYIKYELDYHKFGKKVAENLIFQKKRKREIISNYGYRDFSFPENKKKVDLNILTIDSPESDAMYALSRKYEKNTGVKININIETYDNINKILSSSCIEDYDVVRIDVNLASWYCDNILTPLDKIDLDIKNLKDIYIDNVWSRYAIVNENVFFLPYTPSTQVLFYRKDLFESVIYQRVFHETYGYPLKIPGTFKEYNDIASFFTKKVTPASPLTYGAVLTLGNNGVIGSEFLMRFFSHRKNLYNEDNIIKLNNDAGINAFNELKYIYELSDGKTMGWWKNTASCFAEGNIAMTTLYSNFASDLLGSNSDLNSKVGFAPIPGRNPLIGGGALGVTKFSKPKQEALNYVKWMCSEPVSSANTVLGGSSGCKNTYDNNEVINEYPWLPLVKSGLSEAEGLRKPKNSTKAFNENMLNEIIATEINQVLIYNKNVKDALNTMQLKIAKRMI